MSLTPLSDSRELVERSIFHSIRKELVDKGYLPDVEAKVIRPITTVNIGSQTFQVATNVTSFFSPGRIFQVILSTGNNANYTITTSVFTTVTTITVAEAIPSAIVDGSISIYFYYDDPIGVALLSNAITNIKNTQGFAIEVFGSSNSQAKYLKKIPRIVIITNQSLPGALGGAPDRIYTPFNDDPLNPGSFSVSIQPPQTVELTFDIHLVSNSAVQSRILHGIIGLATPKRGYIESYVDTNQKIFVNQYSYRSITNTTEGINEDIYMYKAEDIFETENIVTGVVVAPINQITVDFQDGEPGDSEYMEDMIIP
jgi:hypothetical protein